MTIENVTEMWDQVARETRVTEKEFTTTRRRAWQVIHSAGENEDTIERAPGISLGSIYPGLPYVRAKSRSMQKLSPIHSMVVIEYEGLIGEQQRDPFDTRPIIDFLTTSTTEAIDEDVYGAPIMTKAGERYENVTDERPDRVIQIRRNFKTFITAAVDPFLVSYNADMFLNYVPGQVRCKSLDATTVYIGDSTNFYYSVTGRFECRTLTRASVPQKTWFKRIRHEGFYCLEDDPFNPGTSIKTHARVRGKPVSRPVLLDADGKQLPDTATTATWQEWQTRVFLPYAALNFLR